MLCSLNINYCGANSKPISSLKTTLQGMSRLAYTMKWQLQLQVTTQFWVGDGTCSNNLAYVH